MAKFYGNLTKDQVIERLTAQDIRTVIMAYEDNDFEYLRDIIQGNGYIPYKTMTDSALLEEYEDRKDRIEELIEDNLLLYPID